MDTTKKSLPGLALALIRRWNRKKETPPEGEPYAYVGAPLCHGPKDRSDAAVAEIQDDSYRSYPPRK